MNKLKIFVSLLYICISTVLFAETVNLYPTDDITIGNPDAVDQQEGEKYINKGDHIRMSVTSFKC